MMKRIKLTFTENSFVNSDKTKLLTYKKDVEITDPFRLQRKKDDVFKDFLSSTFKSNPLLNKKQSRGDSQRPGN